MRVPSRLVQKRTCCVEGDMDRPTTMQGIVAWHVALSEGCERVTPPRANLRYCLDHIRAAGFRLRGGRIPGSQILTAPAPDQPPIDGRAPQADRLPAFECLHNLRAPSRVLRRNKRARR